jgi:Fe-Mn family superoxide dismutase
MSSYSVRTFDNLKGLQGFSEQAVLMHLTLYKGYVDNTNMLAERLREALKTGTTMSAEWKELKRRFAWEFNGMRLHEYYFENMTSQPASLAPTSPVRRKIEEDFGGYDIWERGFKETGAMRGIGWVMLTLDAQTGRLFNVWLDEHDAGLLAGTTPLLIMDVFEHAVLPDFGLKRPDYIAAFFRVIDWEAVEARLEAALKR